MPSLSASAFTFIELLVVIAVLGVLAALLAPALGRGRGRARDAQCLGNLRQLGLLVRLHAEDHGGRLPRLRADFATGPARAADLALLNLREPRLLRCPADRSGPARPDPMSYVWNTAAGGRLLHGDSLAEAAARNAMSGALFHDREPWHGHRNGVMPDGRAVALKEGP
ncbi:MAG TPA: prepilin-type N-terminal cleavage/methylation domain-containing protein [Verrucomicrobiota bacterium]|nr:prepilin-type N-terminal cleavage/methylation domain-containing protein [Verrucomicrobiota bacterium]